MRLLVSVVVASLILLALPSAAHAEKTEGSNAPSLATSGLVLFAGTYGYAATVGAAMYRMSDDSVASKMFIPVAGPWLLLKDQRWDQDSTITARLVEATGANRCDATVCGAALLFLPVALLEYGMLIVDPIAQATGIVMTFVGATKESRDDRASPSPSTEKEAAVRAPRPKVSVKPTSIGAMGAGVSLSITEW